ncbi:MAG: hypothetical protein KGZ93_06120 [Actinobacteria bacterium]|nr:hypothetical protein [Actinomycetota bacterium]
MRDKRPNLDISSDEIESVRKEVAYRVKKGVSKSELEKIMAPAKKAKVVRTATKKVSQAHS